MIQRVYANYDNELGKQLDIRTSAMKCIARQDMPTLLSVLPVLTSTKR
ncbi:MAG: hypothetical protein PUP46_08585 [Endozoicomonas sp. (ex Botrylloides leachii)]|nr:hypothetical protein [Endozoicomonas sp. (ex Botrylloides leachii)]